jgi:hypothetical protein
VRTSLRCVTVASLIASLEAVACAVAFTPGTHSASAPEKFADLDVAPPREDEKKEEATVSTAPAVGMSLVIGGTAFDAGALPKPPFPIVLLPP